MAEVIGLETFRGMQNRIMFPLGLKNPAEREVVKGAWNEALQDFHDDLEWDYKEGRAFFNTVLPYETGTVDVTNDSATLVGTSTVWAQAMVDDRRKFALTAAKPWYELLTFGSTTSLTLDRAYQGDTESGASYTIYQDEYNLDPTVDQTRRCMFYLHEESGRELGDLSQREMFDDGSIARSTGEPRNITMLGEDTGMIRVMLWPIPDAVYQIRYRFMKKYVPMADDNDSCVVPEKLRSKVLWDVRSRVKAELPQWSGQEAAADFARFIQLHAPAGKRNLRKTVSVTRIRAYDHGIAGHRRGIRRPGGPIA